MYHNLLHFLKGELRAQVALLASFEYFSFRLPTLHSSFLPFLSRPILFVSFRLSTYQPTHLRTFCVYMSVYKSVNHYFFLYRFYLSCFLYIFLSFFQVILIAIRNKILPEGCPRCSGLFTTNSTRGNEFVRRWKGFIS